MPLTMQIVQATESIVGETTVFIPGGRGDLVTALSEYLRQHYGKMPVKLRPYVMGLRVVWPELFKADVKAAYILACDVYLHVAEVEGFTVDEDACQEVA